jgi:hypothetical protein
MTDVQKDVKNAGQNLEAKAETAKDHAQGKPSSETLNKAKIKAEDGAQDVKRDLQNSLVLGFLDLHLQNPST